MIPDLILFSLGGVFFSISVYMCDEFIYVASFSSLYILLCYWASVQWRCGEGCSVTCIFCGFFSFFLGACIMSSYI
ncbi:hypothetical protein B0T26DRAFT_294791 [Lasiosphaeria miniovina]|uniref:Uncharacterized protein n=1 Tax=Lasiosphaeria miniovina TaxID=1954250 RepID=A0AA40DY64_9PEZI|nr:uncharacterized protein B0T26DRAFT_294791 [Lasiosphaeria miniovina]KAK0717351.1 hypothetical protein B0T26DRAFT_294791 [Lasiosphaeria miniovina]